MNAQLIHTRIDELSSPLQQEVLDYIEFLLQKYPQSHTTEEQLSLEKLLDGITEENIHHEVETGIPVGSEVW